jgi:hypothetical protein
MKKKILFTLLIMGILPTIGLSKAKITCSKNNEGGHESQKKLLT